ncbi:PREDICTED: myosin-1 isoform X3 [Prunus mume]|uniref:Myosin-1 isoform X3 n=1 Tax=Prunus mume TaxID=102107 RepID=A0ABM1LUG9_PRUMU|nr:PREDICTED: myosin-1 isoform X3 [Prunus mume]
MEDDKKKKKKNKKKKNKQVETTDNVPVSGNDQVSKDAADDGRLDDVPVTGNGQVPEAVADVCSDAMQDVDANGNRNESNGTECSLAESEKQHWLQREATLEETIKQLQKETDLHIQKEADQQKEIVQLQSEKDSWLQKEVGFEEKIGQLVDEKATLDSKESSLQEKIKHLERDRDAWILKEDSFKEMVAILNDDVAKLRAQVLELEQSRDNVVQENQQLMENSSSLQLQIKNLESVSSTPSSDELAKHALEREDLNSQVEAACALVEKLMAENAELVEKVNELHVELDRQSATVELTSTKTSNITIAPPETASVIVPMSRSNEDMSTSDQKLDSPEVAPIKQEMHSNGSVDSQHVAFVPELPISDEISEIVQIPLDENEVRNLESSVETDKNDAVPLIDAPLIGAPFRLMSFVARYVSGADLVNQAPTNSSH